MRNDKNRPFTKLQKLIILELPKLPETADGVLWPWLKFFKCKNKEEYKMLAKKHPEMKKPIYYARKMSLIDKWRDYLFHKNLAKVDERMLKLQWQEDAYAEGRTEEKHVIARNLLSESLSHELIQRTTGLSLEEITKL
ncbi:MAG: hypothetical protein LBC80_01870 [Treponema sp.]|jgi:predicted transposase/invertase (TIGR01784 family)|nr:hypothetical protein [Treponema sp.]